MRIKYNQKTRRAINRVRKILIKNKKQHCYMLFIYFSSETMNKTTKETRHKYTITALNSLCCDYIAIENNNKDETREHYRALISTDYRKLVNHLTFKWLSTKGALRHKYIDSKMKESNKVSKITARISGLTKRTLNEIANKNIIYSDINKPNELKTLRENINRINAQIIYNKKVKKDIKSLQIERDKNIFKLRETLRNKLTYIAKMFNTNKGAKNDIAIYMDSLQDTFKTTSDYKSELEQQKLIDELIQSEKANRLINEKEYNQIIKIKNKTREQELLIIYYETEQQYKKDKTRNFFSEKVELIKEYQTRPITKERYIELLNKNYKELTEQERHEIYIFDIIKPYTSEQIKNKIADKLNRDIDEKLGL